MKIINERISREECLDEISKFYFHKNEIRVKHKEVETRKSDLKIKSINNRFHRRIGVEFESMELINLKLLSRRIYIMFREPSLE